MVELIEEIVHAEQDAEGLIREARERATAEKRSREESLSGQLSQAREEAKRQAQERIEARRSELAGETPSVSPRVDGDEFLAEHSEAVEALVEEIVGVILQTELDRP